MSIKRRIRSLEKTKSGPERPWNPVIFFETDGEGNKLPPPTDPPEAMEIPVYCAKQGWIDLPPHNDPEPHVYLYLPVKKEIDLTGGVYDDDGGPAEGP